jgi:DNA-binding GntR family transcriptional regulator
VRTTARAAALYLQVEQASLRDLMEVTDALQQCLLALACDSEEVNKKNVLRAFLAALSEQGAPEDLARFLELERTFERLVLDVAGNPALRLFLQIAGKFVDENPASQALIANPAMRRLRCAAWARMGEAILAGNTAACLEISRQQSAAFVALVPDQALAASAVGAERAAATDWHG